MANFLSHFHLRRAVQAVQQGNLIAYPTEGVWGLGCDPHNADAVHKLLALKQRHVKKGLILVAATIEQFEPYLTQLSQQQRETLNKSWPGPQTWLVPANEHVPLWISGGQPTVALRVSTHPVIVALCKRFGGPIVSTSANTSGKSPARNLLDIQLQFSSPFSLFCGETVTVVPGSLGDNRKPSSIRDLITGTIIRH